MITLGGPHGAKINTPKILVVGIAGRMKSGKNQFADYVKEIIEERKAKGYFSTYDVKIYAFADPLKECLIRTFGIRKDALYTQEGKASMNYRWSMTHREILQKFGTNAVRKHLHPDAWVFAMEEYLDSLEKDTIVIIPDVRFENEANLCNSYGWVVKVERPSIVSFWTKLREKLGLVHPSEKPLSSKHFIQIIKNDGTLSQLRAKASLFVSWLSH